MSASVVANGRCVKVGCVHQRWYTVCDRHTCVQTVMQYSRKSRSSQRISCLDFTVDDLNLSLYGGFNITHILLLSILESFIMRHTAQPQLAVQKDVVRLLCLKGAGDFANHITLQSSSQRCIAHVACGGLQRDVDRSTDRVCGG